MSKDPTDNVEFNEDAEGELEFSMPEFKLPTVEADAIDRDSLIATQVIPIDLSERILEESEAQESNVAMEELAFDREELVRTRNMTAFSRQELLPSLQTEGWLNDQRFAPDVLISPPRVLTKSWQDGIERRTRIAPISEVTEVTEAKEDPPHRNHPKIDDTISENLISTEMDAIELEDVEVVAELPTPPPRRSKGPPPKRPPELTPTPTQEIQEDDDLNGIVQELLEEESKRETTPAPEEERHNGWFNAVFDEEFLRTLPKNLKSETAREVKFIKSSLGLKKGARILDLGCGFGRHAVELAEEGYEVAGLDTSIDLLQHALTQAKKRNLAIKFIHGDMRELNFSEIFDAVYCWQTTFGYFSDRINIRVLEGLNRALKMGGRLLIDTVNRDYVVAEMPTRTWWEGIECVFLEEIEFDHENSILHTKRSFIYDGAPPREYSSYIRLYSLHEFKRILGYCGFRVIEISGEIFHRGAYLGPASRRTILLAEKVTTVK